MYYSVYKEPHQVDGFVRRHYRGEESYKRVYVIAFLVARCDAEQDMLKQ